MARSKHPLRLWLGSQGESAYSFAKRVGCSPALVSFWLTGKSYPSMKSMIAIARVTKGAVMPNDWMPSNWRRKSNN